MGALLAQCFDEAYWIDQHEVTRGAFAQVFSPGYRIESNLMPIRDVSWKRAYDYCEARGARLPTEAEWEYAARGPASLNYPWGNRYVDANVRSDYPPVEANSYPQGASWVGALHMSGNVDEYTRSRYMPYPYNANDSRTNDAGNRDLGYVIRGGSVYSSHAQLRSYARKNGDGFVQGPTTGFRCVRSDLPGGSDASQ